MYRSAQSMLAVYLVGALVLACSKKDKDDDDSPTAATPPVSNTSTDKQDAVRPGAVITTLDKAMGSIAFAGQAGSSLRLTGDWASEHCEAEGNATKAAYEGQDDVLWGCLLSTATDGPDTPRGGLTRVKQIACSIDRALASGDLVIDDTAHEFKAAIDEECWGADFAAMVAEEMPELVNAATGDAEVDLTVTGYTSVPATWSDTPSDWDTAVEIVFGFSEDDTMTYKLLLVQGDDGVAAQILSIDTSRTEVFAMAITKTGGAEDQHDFRYEGRFPFGQFGDSTFGSRHVRVLVTGPYAGGGGFTRIDSGSGYEADAFGSDASTVTNSWVTSFMADTTGLGAKRWNLDAAGAVSGAATTYGVANNTFAYTGAATELPAFLTTSIAAFTSSDAWFKSNGPLDFKSVVIGD